MVNVGSVCVWFGVLVRSFFGVSFPTGGYLKVSLSPTSCFLLCSYEQVVLELFLLYVQVFEAFLLVLFSCLFLVISSLFVFPDRSWVELVWLPLPPSPSSVLSVGVSLSLIHISEPTRPKR